MNGKKHIIIASIVFILLCIFRLVTLGSIFITIFCTLTPDMDLKFKKMFKHRNILFHSILIPALSLFGTRGELEYMLVLSVGIHLLCDISLKTKGGTYCITKMNYKQTTWWLLINGLISIGLFIYWVI